MSTAAPVVLAQADEATEVEVRRYDIGSGPLRDVLNQFAVASDLVLSYEGGLTDGLRSEGLSGAYRAEDALSALLEPHRLRWYFTRPGVVTLQAARMPDGAMQLSPLRVEGSVLPTGGQAPGAAGMVQHVERRQLDRLPQTSTGDIFRDLPGVLAASNRNGPSISANIRGAQGMGRVKILVDGTQSTSNDYKGYAGDHDHNYIDPDLIGGVTVEAGPNGGAHGAGAVGGVISLRTLEAGDLIREGNDSGLRVRGVYGNNINRVGRDFVDYSGNPLDIDVPARNVSGSMAYAWRTEDGMEVTAAFVRRLAGNYYAGQRGEAKADYHRGDVVEDYYLSMYEPGDEVFNTSQDSESLLLKLKWWLPRDQSFELGYSSMDSEYGEVRSAAYSWYMAQQALSSVRKRSLTGRYAWNPAGNEWWNLRANAWAVESAERRATNIESGDTDNSSFGGELWNASHFDLPWVGLDLRYGASYFSEKSAVRVETQYYDPDGEREMSGLFVQADAQFGDHVILHGGLRHDRYRVEGGGTYDSPVPGQAPVDFRIDHGDSRFNPSIGFTLVPWRDIDLQFFGRYSRGWRPMTIKETIINYISQQDFVRPEVAISRELGLSFRTQGLWREGDALRTSLTRFSNRYDDYVTGFIGMFTNIDGARFAGYEFSLDYDLGWLFASYAITYYDKVEYCGINKAMHPEEGCSNTQITYAFGDDNIGVFAPPRASEVANLGVRLLDRRLTLGARMTAAGERYLQSIDGNSGWYLSRSHWAPYEIYDLYGSWRLYDRLEAGFALENLRDRFYLEAGTNMMIAIPSPGRTARLTLTYSF